jgi:hypothetical protein
MRIAFSEPSAIDGEGMFDLSPHTIGWLDAAAADLLMLVLLGAVTYWLQR